jgi:hypothetical protein
MSTVRRNPTPECIICRACAQSFHWNGRSMRRPHYCYDATCKRNRQADRSYMYFAANKRKSDAPIVRVWSHEPLSIRPPASVEPTRRVEALLAAAKAARLARERATGQRTFTIETGWAQRPGVGWLDSTSTGQGWGG